MHGSRSKIPSKNLNIPHIYDVKFLALLGAPYIYDIGRLRVNKNNGDIHEGIFETYQILLSKYHFKRKQQEIPQLYGYSTRQIV
jgi:hypothetical protein